MGCWCSKGARADQDDGGQTVHELFPTQAYAGLQVLASAAQTVSAPRRVQPKAWCVHADAAGVFASLCAGAGRTACSYSAREARPRWSAALNGSSHTLVACKTWHLES